MKKIPCLFERDSFPVHPVVFDRVTPGCEWALNPATAMATQKWDGTACAVISGELHKRYDAKAGKPRPPGSIPCGEPDPITGHDPVWVKCRRDDPNDLRHFEAFDADGFADALAAGQTVDATYELVGPKVNGNRHRAERHMLVLHGGCLLDVEDRSFAGIRAFLESFDGEGIVFHGVGEQVGKMCKVRRKDFGFAWPLEVPP